MGRFASLPFGARLFLITGLSRVNLTEDVACRIMEEPMPDSTEMTDHRSPIDAKVAEMTELLRQIVSDAVAAERDRCLQVVLSALHGASDDVTRRLLLAIRAEIDKGEYHSP
jgi:hypothetical protein